MDTIHQQDLRDQAAFGGALAPNSDDPQATLLPTMPHGPVYNSTGEGNAPWPHEPDC